MKRGLIIVVLISALLLISGIAGCSEISNQEQQADNQTAIFTNNKTIISVIENATPQPEINETIPNQTVIVCAKENEQFSKVYTTQYPESCCEGLTEWASGFDTSVSIADKCYETMMLSGNPVGTCINCGNGICDSRENPCNCPEDCKNGEQAQYASVDQFCSSEGFKRYCSQDNPFIDELELCKLCAKTSKFIIKAGETSYNIDTSEISAPGVKIKVNNIEYEVGPAQLTQPYSPISAGDLEFIVTSISGSNSTILVGITKNFTSGETKTFEFDGKTYSVNLVVLGSEARIQVDTQPYSQEGYGESEISAQNAPPYGYYPEKIGNLYFVAKKVFASSREDIADYATILLLFEKEISA